MPKGQRHLTHAGRCRIHALMKSGLSGGAIARQPGRDRTTVWREVRRNSGKARLPARPGAAEVRGAALRGPVGAQEDDAGAVAHGGGAAGAGLEPRAGRRAAAPVGPSGGGICAAGERGRTAGAGPTRAGATSRAGWTSPGARRWLRRRRGPATGRRTRINGAGTGGAVVSLVDRARRYTLLRRPGRKTAAAVGAAMTGMPGPHRGAVHTVTADSGREFADHARVAGALGADFLFARPYHSRERGPTGHTNGLVCPANRH